MANILRVTSEEGDRDEAAHRAQIALDEVIGWFIEDGFTTKEIEDRVHESIERNAEVD